MIDFSTTLRSPNGSHDQRLREDLLYDCAITSEYDEGDFRSIDFARQSIAAKPALFIAFAFAVGGVLGWLTSRR